MPEATSAPTASASRTAALWPVARFPLQHLPWWSRRAVLRVTAATLLAVLAALTLPEAAVEDHALVAGVALLLWWLAALAWVAITRRRPPAELVLTPDTAFVPTSATDTRAHVVTGANLREARLRPRRTGGADVRICTVDRVIHLPRGTLAPEEARHVVTALLDLAGRTQNPASLESMRTRLSLASVLDARRPWVTWLLVGLCVALFVLVDQDPEAARPYGMLSWGAHSGPLMRQGEWFRLLTGNFLHRHAWHLWGNLSLLLVLGWPLERVLGSARMASLVLLASLCAGLASNLGGHVMGLGVSGVVFAVVSAAVTVWWRHHRVLPGRFGVHGRAMSWAVLAFMLVDTGAQALWPEDTPGPQLDHAAHAVGAAVGLLWALLTPVRTLASAGVASPPVRVWLLAAGGVHAAAALACAADTHPLSHEVRRGLLAAVADDDNDTDALNQAAWFTALDPTASPQDLERAERLARLAVHREPTATNLDTLATVLGRTGAVEEALGLEWRSFVEPSRARGFYASQLARMGERLGGHAPAERHQGVAIHVRVQPAPLDDGSDAPPEVLLEVAGLPEGQAVPRMLVAVTRQGQEHGELVVLMCVDGSGSADVRGPLSRGLLSRMARGGPLLLHAVLMFEPSVHLKDACDQGAMAFPRDPTVAQIP